MFNENAITGLEISDSELKECKEALRISGFSSIFTGSWYWTTHIHAYSDEKIAERAKSARALFAVDFGSASPCLFFTDAFLVIVYKPMSTVTGRRISNSFSPDSLESKFESGGNTVKAIPLSSVKSVEFSDSRSLGKTELKTGTVKGGNPVMGAIVGGAIAGSTGAVIGAVAASQPKTITIQPELYYDNVKVNIRINMINGGSLFNEMFYGSKGSNSFVSDEGNWSLTMNECLTGVSHTVETIHSGYVTQKYNEIMRDILNGYPDFSIRKKIISDLEMKYNVDLRCSKYSYPDYFTYSLYRTGVYQNMDKEVKEYVQEYADYMNEKNDLAEQLVKKQQDIKSIGSIQFIKRAKVKDELERIKGKLCDMKFDYRSDIFELCAQ